MTPDALTSMTDVELEAAYCRLAYENRKGNSLAVPDRVLKQMRRIVKEQARRMQTTITSGD